MAKVSYSLAQILARIAGQTEFAQGETVSFAFTAPGWSPYGAVSGLNDTQKASASLAMALWDDVSTLHFSRAADGTTSADIKMYNVANPNFAGGQLGDQIMLSSSYDYMTNPGIGNYGFLAIIHEVGHSLGLNHPGKYNGGSPTYAKNAGYAQDTHQYTVMSYFSASNTGANHGGYYPGTPMLHDIAALHRMYGADMTIRTGDTVYGFNSTADRVVYNFAVNANPILCIWDAGGTDTIDVSGFGTNQVIDLREGAFSNVGNLTKNLSIAFGCAIENATGGSGHDSMMGNALNNVLRGGGGNDLLNGERGNDSLFGGAGDDAFVVDSAGDTVSENTGEGTDTVTSSVTFVLPANVENLILTGSLALNGTGNALANTLTGNGGNNVLDGQGGDDLMIGLRGNDTYVVDSAGDVVREVAGQGIDLVLSSVSFVLSENVERLTLTGSAALNGTGNALANVITGNDGANVLRGGGGADTLMGAAGNDTLKGEVGNDLLWGGDGADVFFFDTVGGRDTVKDFNLAQGDVLNVHDLFLTAVVEDSLASFLRFTKSGANTLLLVDRDGSGGSCSMVQVALLEKVVNLSVQNLFDSGNLIA